MRHLDLSFEGKRLAERNQLDNGKLPHGGYRGTKQYPMTMSHLFYDKGRDFQNKLQEELSRVMEYEEMTKHGGSPAWSLLVHNAPSYTDESPLITNNLLAASKVEQINGISFNNRQSLLPKKSPKLLKSAGYSYYRPNRMHQYLSATELKNSASEDANLKYGRPTRTTLLRARQRSNSAPINQFEKKHQKDLTQRLDDVKTAPSGTAQNTEYLQLQSVRDGESLHSYLTGARYNRANCLDSKSVEHNGVYMPRHNPALGSFFTGPKGQEYLREFEDSPRQDFPTPPSPPSPRRRPMTAPSYGRRPVYVPAPPAFKIDQAGSSKYKYLKLNIVGSRLPLFNSHQAQHQNQQGLRLPRLQETATLSSDRRLEEALDQTYLVNQPLPSPVGPGEASPFRIVHDQFHVREHGPALEVLDQRLSQQIRGGDDHLGVGAIRIEGKSTWKVKAMVEEEEEENRDELENDENLVSVPAAPVEVQENKVEVEENETEKDEEHDEANVKEESKSLDGITEAAPTVDEAEPVLGEDEVVSQVPDKEVEEEKEESPPGETQLDEEAGQAEVVSEETERVVEEERERVDELEEVDEIPKEEQQEQLVIDQPNDGDEPLDKAENNEQEEIETEEEVDQRNENIESQDTAVEEDEDDDRESASKEVRFFLTEDGVGNVVMPEHGVAAYDSAAADEDNERDADGDNDDEHTHDT